MATEEAASLCQEEKETGHHLFNGPTQPPTVERQSPSAYHFFGCPIFNMDTTLSHPDCQQKFWIQQDAIATDNERKK